MEEIEYKERTEKMNKKFHLIRKKMKEINSGDLENIPVEDFKKLMAGLKDIRENIENTIIELEVDDFLENGAGRSRDVEYK